MDNKQNKQFYWEVKEFLERKKPVQKAPQSSLNGVVRNIMESNYNKIGPNYYETKDAIINSSRSTQRAVSDVLNNYSYNMILQNPSCKGYSANITSNIFNIVK
jgi:hypothetical protein